MLSLIKKLFRLNSKTKRRPNFFSIINRLIYKIAILRQEKIEF